MSLPNTAAELDQLVMDYIRRTTAGGLGPAPMSNAELGARFRESLDDAPAEENEIGRFFASWEPDDAAMGRHIRQMAACGQFEHQVLAHQKAHQISALLERLFTFSPLGFSTIELANGTWLEPINNDLARLHRAAQRLGQEFKALADGAGDTWLRYRQLNFTTKDGTHAWRYIRDDWASLDAVLQQAGSAYLSAGIELGQHKDTALELTAWIGGSWGGMGDGDAHSFQLVHPSLADELDHPDCWWS